jgi:hypothetical protein
MIILEGASVRPTRDFRLPPGPDEIATAIVAAAAIGMFATMGAG